MPTGRSAPHAAIARTTAARIRARGWVRTAGGRRGGASGSGPDDHDRGSAGGHPVDRLVAQGVGDRVLGPRDVRRRPALEAAKRPPGVSQSGTSLLSLTRQRPASCSTISFESRSISTSRAPSSTASARRPDDGRCTRRRCSSGCPGTRRSTRPGRARGSRASGRSSVDQDGPGDAGPGLPRAAPSVRSTKPRGRIAAPASGSVASPSPPDRGRACRLCLPLDDRRADLEDRLGDVDPARAGVGAVEDRPAAPDAVLVGEDLEPLVAALVARCRR